MNPDPASLDRLRDVIAPPPIPWWPPAPGWLWIMGALAIGLLAAALRAFLWWQRHRYRREALAEANRLEQRLGDPSQRAQSLANLAELVKRTALTVFPRGSVASLTGAAWFAFLDRTGGTTEFAAGAGAVLENAAYDEAATARLTEVEAKRASEVAKTWIKHHSKPKEAAST